MQAGSSAPANTPDNTSAPRCCCRLSAAEQYEVENSFTSKFNMLVPFHNLYWTGGSVYTGGQRNHSQQPWQNHVL